MRLVDLQRLVEGLAGHHRLLIGSQVEVVSFVGEVALREGVAPFIERGYARFRIGCLVGSRGELKLFLTPVFALPFLLRGFGILSVDRLRSQSPTESQADPN